MSKIIYLTFLLLFAVISLSFFQDTATVNALHPAVQRTIDERVERYQKRILKACEKRVLETATARVDSIIIANAKRIKAVKVNRPPKPIRPREDGKEVPFDTTRIEPLWDLDSLLYEQLLRRQGRSDRLMFADSILLDSLLLDSLARDSLRLDSLLSQD